METEVEMTDTPVGYTWGKSDGNYYLKSPSGGLRRLSEDGWKLLRALAERDVSKDDLEGTPRKIVEELEAEGYLRPGDSVVKLHQPDPIRLWPRLVLFLVLVAVGVVVAWAEFPTMLGASELLVSSRLIPLIGLVLATIVIHEGGHYLASRPFFDPSLRLGVVNGVVPAVITETTEAWILPKNHRLWITLAGPFVQIVWTLLVAGIHYFFLPESGVLSTFLVIMVVETVFILNPLIHGDGYLLLIDAFGVVDLRTTGIEHLRNRSLTLPAVYAVLSYGFGIGLVLTMITSAASFFL